MPEISSPSISNAWQQAVTRIHAAPRREVFNLEVTITDLETGLQEDAAVRTTLDAALTGAGLAEVRTVSNTIFPLSLWDPGLPRKELFDRYRSMWPKIKKHRNNRRGTYFQRMIDYPEAGPAAFNQLDQVIATYRSGNHRRSALQASVIVPARDLNDSRQQGFPCMQQIAFLPRRNALRVVAVYPMQYLYQRGYGNYLGLVHLGRFMAAEMGLSLQAVTCLSLIAKLDRPSSAASFILP